MNKQTILIVEDDMYMSQYLSALVAKENFKSILAYTGADAFTIINSHCPDLILLDLGLPDMDGMRIIKEVRTWSRVPIIVVSSRTAEREKVLALDSGADDYITKPFGNFELLARIRTALRHLYYYNHTYSQANVPHYNPIVYHNRDLEINYESRSVRLNKRLIHLTKIEYKILTFLAKNAGKIVTYNELVKEIWGPYADKNNRILRVNISNIRHKIETDPNHPQYIITEIGVGYRLSDTEEQNKK